MRKIPLLLIGLLFCTQAMAGDFCVRFPTGTALPVWASTGDLLPYADDTYDIGSATLEWKDLYIDGTGTFDIGIVDTNLFFKYNLIGVEGEEEYNELSFRYGDIWFLTSVTMDACYTLANSLKTVMNAHAADGAEHFKGGNPSPDTVNFPVTEDNADDWNSLVALTDALTIAYASHNSDAVEPIPTFHNAQATNQQLRVSGYVLSLWQIVDRLNNIKYRYNLHDNDAAGHTTGGLHQEANADAVLDGFNSNVGGSMFVVGFDTFRFEMPIRTDTIDEYTTDAGVTIEGVLVKDSDILTDNIELSGASILANATASGILTLGGTGATNNLDLLFDFESSATDIGVSSTAGTMIDWGSLNHQTTGMFGIGTAPSYPLHVVMAAEDTQGIHIDGFTNDATVNSKGLYISKQTANTSAGSLWGIQVDISNVAASHIDVDLYGLEIDVVRTGTYSGIFRPAPIYGIKVNTDPDYTWTYTGAGSDSFAEYGLWFTGNNLGTLVVDGGGTISYANYGGYFKAILQTQATETAGTINKNNYAGYFYSQVADNSGTTKSVGVYSKATGGDTNYDLMLDGGGNIVTNLATGLLTFAGVNGTAGYNESLSLDFDTTDDSVIFTSSATLLDYSALNIDTTGTLGAGAATVTSLDAGSGAIATTGTISDGVVTLDDGALSGVTTINLNDGDGNTGTISVDGSSLTITTTSDEIYFGSKELDRINSIDCTAGENNNIIVDTMTLSGGSIIDSTNAIDFGDENLTTTGDASVSRLAQTGASRARFYKTSDQGIPSSTWTTVNWHAENYDTRGEMDITTNERFTPDESGYYLILAQARLNNVQAEGEYFIVRVLKGSGATEIARSTYKTKAIRGSAEAYLNLQTVVYLTASTDYIYFRAYQDTGVNQNLAGDAAGIWTRASVTRLN